MARRISAVRCLRVRAQVKLSLMLGIGQETHVSLGLPLAVRPNPRSPPWTSTRGKPIGIVYRFRVVTPGSIVSAGD